MAKMINCWLADFLLCKTHLRSWKLLLSFNISFVTLSRSVKKVALVRIPKESIVEVASFWMLVLAILMRMLFGKSSSSVKPNNSTSLGSEIFWCFSTQIKSLFIKESTPSIGPPEQLNKTENWAVLEISSVGTSLFSSEMKNFKVLNLLTKQIFYLHHYVHHQGNHR